MGGGLALSRREGSLLRLASGSVAQPARYWHGTLNDDDIVAVVSRMGSTLKKNGKSMREVEFVQLFSFNQTGKCVRIAEFYDPTESLKLWRS